MKGIKFAHIIIGLLCVTLAGLWGILLCLPSYDKSEQSFGVAICKRTEWVMAGKVSVAEYFLVDQNGKTLLIDGNIYNVLALQECNK